MLVDCEVFYGYRNQKGCFRKFRVKHIDGDTESLFFNQSLIKNGRLLERVFENCIVSVEDDEGNKCLDPLSRVVKGLEIGDTNLIAVAISTATHESTEREFRPCCPECDSPNKIIVDMDKLEKRIPESFPAVNQMTVTVGRRVFTVKYPNFGEFNDITQKHIDENEQMASMITIKNKVLEKSIIKTEFDGVEQKVNDIPGRVLTELGKQIQERLYGVNTEIDCVCHKCKHEWKQNLLMCSVQDGQLGGPWHFFGVTPLT